MSTMGCSVPWGYHDACGGYHEYRGGVQYCKGLSRILWGYDSFKMEKLESHSFNKPFHDRNSCITI